MSDFWKRLDLFLLSLIFVVLLGLPIGIKAYDRALWQKRVPSGARVFTLTGNAERGWLLGDVHAYAITPFWHKKGTMKRPVIEVSKGDLVVLKLESSDVVHGFSLKDFGVFITSGIHPGKVVLVSFVADKVGTFIFSCNSICGKEHENMKGTLVVTA